MGDEWASEMESVHPSLTAHRASSGEGASLQRQRVGAGPGAVLSRRPGVTSAQKAKTSAGDRN